MVAKPLCPLYKNIIKPLDRARYPELRYWLKRLYFTDGYEQYRPEIKELAQRDSLMKFILKPTENLKDMREDWVLWLEDDELRNVIGNDELMIRIGKYCKDVYDNVSKEIKRRIWKVITTNNIESQI